MDPAQFYMKADRIPALMKFTSIRELDSWDLNRKVTSYAKGDKSGKMIFQKVSDRVSPWRVEHESSR